jgi:hypothetical protein
VEKQQKEISKKVVDKLTKHIYNKDCVSNSREIDSVVEIQQKIFQKGVDNTQTRKYNRDMLAIPLA